jgi:hypothetical protein
MAVSLGGAYVENHSITVSPQWLVAQFAATTQSVDNSTTVPGAAK